MTVDSENDDLPSDPSDDGQDADEDAVFRALWERVLASWDDDKPHQAILEHALRTQRLPVLAGRYRSLKDDPEKQARAQKKMDGIVAAATQMLFATKSPVRTKVPWTWTASVAVVCLLVLAWLTYKVVLRH